MLIDGRQLPENTCLSADVAIVGAGGAGIPLALELERHTKLDILLLEGGKLERSEGSQSLYAGESIGWASRNSAGDDLVYDRIRAYGGSTWAWGGQCRPLDDIDFEPRDWVPGSGWPISAQALRPYYERAHEYLTLGHYEYDYERWRNAADKRESEPDLPGLAGLQPCLFQWARHTRFAPLYRERLARSERIKLVNQANLVAADYRRDEDTVTLDGLNFATLDRKPFSAKARRFVFAMGGIENPRQLLLHGPQSCGGFGNRHGHLGRYFQQHSYLMSGKATVAGKALNAIEYHRKMTRRKQPHSLMVRLDDRIQRDRKTLNYSACLFHSNALTALHRLGFAVRNWNYYWNRVPGDLRHIRRELGAFIKYHSARKRSYTIYHGLEQTPNASSRVSLADRKDRLGLPQVKLDWQFDELDFHTFRVGQKQFAKALEESGLGRVELEITGDNARWDRVDGGAHHIGTTRMAEREDDGVVDADLLVFGTRNLYVAGSSVFRTSGIANPTLTIVATALRLADHLGT